MTVDDLREELERLRSERDDVLDAIWNYDPPGFSDPSTWAAWHRLPVVRVLAKLVTQLNRECTAAKRAVWSHERRQT